MTDLQTSDDVDLSSWAQERLELELCRFAADLAAAEARFLRLVAEFDRREGWADWGCRSCAHWLSWHCGMALSTARDHVRVARRLQTFPTTAAEFSAGRLSYSKVRALTRVLTPANEPTLLEYAQEATAGQLDHLLRAYKSVRDDIDDRNAPDPEAARRERRQVSWWWDDDGWLRMEARLPPEEGIVVLRALRMNEPMDEPAPPAEPPPPADPPAPVPAPDDASADASSDVIEFVDEDGEVIRIGGPAVEPAIEDASAEAPQTQPTRSGAGARWADALVEVAERALLSGPSIGPRGIRPEVLVHIDLALLAAGDHDPSGRAAAYLDDGPTLNADVARQLACDAGLRVVITDGPTGQTLDVGRSSRHPTPAQRTALWERDGGCVFPGCDATGLVDAHHIVHWEHGGPTSLDNLALLCRRHHRLIHNHKWEIRRTGPGTFEFHRADGSVAEPWETGEDRADIAAVNRALGIEPAADALEARSGGARYDINDAILGILTADGYPSL